MRIAFDLDETLVPSAGGTESVGFAPFRWVFRERLRTGAVELLQGLVRDGHDIWIYTTSVRSQRYVRWWFRLLGVRLGGVVNGDRHARVLRDHPSEVRSLSKFPPAFLIDLLVDDLPGVALEGHQHRFSVLIIDAKDEGWAACVQDAVAAARAAAPADQL